MANRVKQSHILKRLPRRYASRNDKKDFMKILIIDNYDSYTYNIYQLVGEILMKTKKPFVVDVYRNDKISIRDITKKKYDRIIISPGPGDPSDKAYFGVCAEVLTEIGKTIPVLGVCLGMQGMAYYFGGKVVKATLPMHGKTSIISHDGKGIFKGLPQGLEVMRYHSLVADLLTLPSVLEVTACTTTQAGSRFTVHSLQKKDVEIMGLRHKKFPIEGIQFHPESFATEGGKLMMENFLFQKNQEL